MKARLDANRRADSEVVVKIKGNRFERNKIDRRNMQASQAEGKAEGRERTKKVLLIRRNC